MSLIGSGDSAVKFVTRKDGKDTEFNTIGYIEKDKSIYYNKAKVCNNVELFKVTKSKENGKDKLTITIKFDGNEKTYSTEYVMRNQMEN
ncbi:MAG: hypothetical protein IKG42_06910 [Clostridia bacterium]|nr:hypothetical protein [Clostridia bacterium]